MVSSISLIILAIILFINLDQNTVATDDTVATVSLKQQLYLSFDSITYFTDIISTRRNVHAEIRNKGPYLYLYDHHFYLYYYDHYGWRLLYSVITGIFPIAPPPPILIKPHSVTPLTFGPSRYGNLSSGMYKIVMEVERFVDGKVTHIYVTFFHPYFHRTIEPCVSWNCLGR